MVKFDQGKDSGPEMEMECGTCWDFDEEQVRRRRRRW